MNRNISKSQVVRLGMIGGALAIVIAIAIGWFAISNSSPAYAFTAQEKGDIINTARGDVTVAEGEELKLEVGNYADVTYAWFKDGNAITGQDTNAFVKLASGADAGTYYAVIAETSNSSNMAQTKDWVVTVTAAAAQPTAAPTTAATTTAAISTPAPTAAPTATPAPTAAATTAPTANKEATLITILTDANATTTKLESALILAEQIASPSQDLQDAMQVAEDRLFSLALVELGAKELVARDQFNWESGAALSGDWAPARPLKGKAINITGTKSRQIVEVVINDLGDGNKAEVCIVNGIDINIVDANGEPVIFSDGVIPAREIGQGDSATIIGLTKPGTYYVRCGDAGIFFYEVYGWNLRGAVDVLMGEVYAKESNVYEHVELDESGNPVTVSYDRDGTKVTGAASIVPYIYNGDQLAVWETQRIDLLKLVGDPDAVANFSRNIYIQGVEIDIQPNQDGREYRDDELEDYTVVPSKLGVFVGNLNGNEGVTFIRGNHFDVPSTGQYFQFDVEPGYEDKAEELAKEYILSSGLDLTGMVEFQLSE